MKPIRLVSMREYKFRIRSQLGGIILYINTARPKTTFTIARPVIPGLYLSYKQHQAEMAAAKYSLKGLKEVNWVQTAWPRHFWFQVAMNDSRYSGGKSAQTNIYIREHIMPTILFLRAESFCNRRSHGHYASVYVPA